MSDLQRILDLLEKAKSKSKKDSKIVSNVKKFVEDNKIESGSCKVPNQVIFHFYRHKWDTSGFKASKIGFFRELKKYLPRYRQGRGRYYMIKEGIFDNSLEHRKFCIKYDRHYNGRRKKEKL